MLGLRKAIGELQNNPAKGKPIHCPAGPALRKGELFESARRSDSA